MNTVQSATVNYIRLCLRTVGTGSTQNDLKTPKNDYKLYPSIFKLYSRP